MKIYINYEEKEVYLFLTAENAAEAYYLDKLQADLQIAKRALDENEKIISFTACSSGRGYTVTIKISN